MAFSDIKLRFLGEAYVYVDIAVGNQRRKCESEEEYFDNTFSVIAMGNFVMILTAIEIRNSKINVVEPFFESFITFYYRFR